MSKHGARRESVVSVLRSVAAILMMAVIRAWPLHAYSQHLTPSPQDTQYVLWSYFRGAGRCQYDDGTPRYPEAYR